MYSIIIVLGMDKSLFAVPRRIFLDTQAAVEFKKEETYGCILPIGPAIVKVKIYRTNSDIDKSVYFHQGA